MRISDWSSDVCSSDLPSRFKLGGRLNGLRDEVERAPWSLVRQLQPSRGQLLCRSDHLLERSAVSSQLDRSRSRILSHRSEERRVGKEWVRTFRIRWSPDH